MASFLYYWCRSILYIVQIEWYFGYFLQFYIPYYLMSVAEENKHSEEGAMHVVYGKKWHGVNEWHGRGTNVASCIQSIIK